MAVSDKINELFLENVGRGLDQQLSLGEFLGDHDWEFDKTAGAITFITGKFIFKKKRPFKAQILGTESEVSNTWLWSWANEASEIPQLLQQTALELKKFGETEGIREFTEPQFPLEGLTGHHLAMIASGVCRASFYYRCPYEGGAAFVLVRDAPLERKIPMPCVRIGTIFPQVISSFDISDHKKAFKAYLKSYLLNVTEDGSCVTGNASGGDEITATFDELNRLTGMDIRVQGMSIME